MTNFEEKLKLKSLPDARKPFYVSFDKLFELQDAVQMRSYPQTCLKL